MKQEQEQTQTATPNLTLDQAYANVVAIGRAYVCNADQRDLINSSIEMLRQRCLRAAELEKLYVELTEANAKPGEIAKPGEVAKPEEARFDVIDKTYSEDDYYTY